MIKSISVIICVIACTFLLKGCTPNNVKIDNSIKKYFDDNQVSGSFSIFDNGEGSFTIYNLSRYKDSAYLPASTFKIVNSLIGLQTGVITNEKMLIKWDGIKRWNENWNKDLTMEEAFKFSAVPYYQEVARRIGKDTMQLWLDSLHYGNKKIGNRIDSFWLDNSLKITADEQLGLVKQLYFGKLPFNKFSTEIVKKVMVHENNSKYLLAYKTGLGYRENGNAIGWIVGWVEENHHPYFFVLNIEGKHNMDLVAIRTNMLMNILKQEGFLEGKR